MVVLIRSPPTSTGVEIEALSARAPAGKARATAMRAVRRKPFNQTHRGGGRGICPLFGPVEVPVATPPHATVGAPRARLGSPKGAHAPERLAEDVDLRPA